MKISVSTLLLAIIPLGVVGTGEIIHRPGAICEAEIARTGFNKYYGRFKSTVDDMKVSCPLQLNHVDGYLDEEGAKPWNDILEAKVRFRNDSSTQVRQLSCNLTVRDEDGDVLARDKHVFDMQPGEKLWVDFRARWGAEMGAYPFLFCFLAKDTGIQSIYTYHDLDA